MDFLTTMSVFMFCWFSLMAIYWVAKACSFNQRLKANQELKAWRLKQQSAWKITEPANSKPKVTDDIPVFLKGVEE